MTKYILCTLIILVVGCSSNFDASYEYEDQYVKITGRTNDVTCQIANKTGSDLVLKFIDYDRSIVLLLTIPKNQTVVCPGVRLCNKTYPWALYTYVLNDMFHHLQYVELDGKFKFIPILEL